MTSLPRNALARALNEPLYENPVRPVNFAQFRFLNPRAVDFFRVWDITANDVVALLRIEAAENPTTSP